MMTKLNKLNFYWFNKLNQIRHEIPQGYKIYMNMLNVFYADHVNLPKPKIRKIIKGKILIYKRIHPGWVGWQRILHPKSINANTDLIKLLTRKSRKGPFSKWQYFYKSSKGTISMVKLYQWVDNKNVYEIYAYDNPRLFLDVERFDSKEKAENRIRVLLKPDKENMK
jgi:hypothetical protein